MIWINETETKGIKPVLFSSGWKKQSVPAMPGPAIVPGQPPMERRVNVIEVGEQMKTSTPRVDATTEETSRDSDSATKPSMLACDLNATRDMMFSYG